MSDSPCIGICSTTYGDFVCRGCKRFAHEVTGWNHYTRAQREAVWERLSKLLTQSMQDHLVRDHQADAMRFFFFKQKTAYEILAQLKAEVASDARQDMAVCLQRLGLAPCAEPSSIDRLPALVDAIENGFLMRSEAHYEHSFSTSLASAVRRHDHGKGS